MPLVEFEDDIPNHARIKVIGVGGGGGNAINTMIASGLDGVDFIAANTDLQALDSNLAPMKIQLGAELTRGLGAGANPAKGRDAALADSEKLLSVLGDADMVFVTAGMGGGTGTGGAPVIAKVAKEAGALTVGVVTKPFPFEGKKRMRQAIEGIIQLQESVDTLITIPNERLLSVAGQATTMLDAFRRVDEVLLNAVQGISDLIVIHGFINVDFADVRTVMSDMGRALMGTGYAAGDRKALEAAQQAVSSPLLEDASIHGATGILINITGGPDLTLSEIHEAATLIQEAAHEDANIIFGSVVDANMEDQVRITVIATGFDRLEKAQSVSGAYYSVPSMPASRGHQLEMAAAQLRPSPERQLGKPGFIRTVDALPPMPQAPRAQPAPYVPRVNAPEAPVAREQPTAVAAPAPSSVFVDFSEELNAAGMGGHDEDALVAMQALQHERDFGPDAPRAGSVQLPAARVGSAPATAPTTHHMAPLSSQGAYTVPRRAERSDGTPAPARRTSPQRLSTAGHPVVPMIHPGLTVPDDSEMDIPAFIRKNQPISGD